MAINKGSRWGNVEGKISTIVRHAFQEIHILFVPIPSLLSFKRSAWDIRKCVNSVWNGSILKPFVFELEDSGRRDMRGSLQLKRAENFCCRWPDLSVQWRVVFFMKSRICNTTYTSLPVKCLGIALVLRNRKRPSKLKSNLEGSLA